MDLGSEREDVGRIAFQGSTHGVKLEEDLVLTFEVARNLGKKIPDRRPFAANREYCDVGSSHVSIVTPVKSRQGGSMKLVVASFVLVAALTLPSTFSVAYPPGKPPLEVKESKVLCPSADVEPGPYKPFRFETLEGKRLWRAKAIAKRHGCVLRVTTINGKALGVTGDYEYNRINVGIRGSKKRGWKVVSAGSVG